MYYRLPNNEISDYGAKARRTYVKRQGVVAEVLSTDEIISKLIELFNQGVLDIERRNPNGNTKELKTQLGLLWGKIKKSALRLDDISPEVLEARFRKNKKVSDILDLILVKKSTEN